MGFPTKVQLIKRKRSEQWYVNLPSAVAQAMEFGKGEIVEWIIADKGHLILARSSAPPNPVRVKKLRFTARCLGRDYWIVCQSLLHNHLRERGTRQRSFNRFREHILSTLLCLGRRTVTGIITTAGRQYEDWSVHYRMYSKSRVEPQECFAVIREKIERMLPPDMPMVVTLDDTLRQKSGTGIHGVAWRRDPLGPKFQANLVLAQRFIQLSAALAAEDGSARMIPIDLTHAPSAPKPGAKATAAQIQCYKESKNQLKLNRQAHRARWSAQRFYGRRTRTDDRGRRQLYQWRLPQGSA